MTHQLIHGSAHSLPRTYLLPPLPRPGDGADIAHIDANGRPACGVVLDAPYAVAAWLYAYNVCPDCERAVRTGQMGLFATTPAPPTAAQDGVRRDL